MREKFLIALFLLIWRIGVGKVSHNDYKKYNNTICDQTASSNKQYHSYFQSLKKIYRDFEKETCVPIHRQCGWPKQNSKLPQFVLIIGLEGSAHHFWTKLLYTPVIECVWVNSRHYRRDVGDGVPRRTPPELRSGILEQMEIREREAPPRCKRILDSEDSFPTGAIRKPGRLFMHPDLVNLHAIDGDIVNMKYLVIVRNTTDTVMSALRRDFVSSFEQGIHIAEHTMIHIEAALRLIPCHKIFIAHYEHVLSDPLSFYEPLSDFLELEPDAKRAYKSRLEELKPAFPARQHHTLTQFKECKESHLSAEDCYQMFLRKMERFFHERSFMWPTFAANGYDLQDGVSVPVP